MIARTRCTQSALCTPRLQQEAAHRHTGQACRSRLFRKAVPAFISSGSSKREGVMALAESGGGAVISKEQSWRTFRSRMCGDNPQ